MKAFAPDYSMVTPKDLQEVLVKLKTEPGKWTPFAGGTDLMVLFEAGKLSSQNFINIQSLEELNQIEVEAGYILLGALTTYSAIQQNKSVFEEFPSLHEAARSTGAIAIQNRGTIGGNIANASPAADSPPALLVYDAEIELASVAGRRWVPYSEFHLAYKKTQKQPEELLTRIRLPLIKNAKGSVISHFYRKVGTRKAQAISKVCIAAKALIRSGKIIEPRVAFASVGPVPLRCKKVEEILDAKKHRQVKFESLSDALEKDIAPVSDIRSTQKYRMQVAKNLVWQWIQGLNHVELD